MASDPISFPLPQDKSAVLATPLASSLPQRRPFESSPFAIAQGKQGKPWTLPPSGLALFYGRPETPRLFHYFLPSLLAEGKQVLCLDGANRFDPLLIARLARQRGREVAEFNRRIRVARAFTCFQLTELLVRVPRLLEKFAADALIVTALPDLYFDEDVRERDAGVAFRHALDALRALRPLPLGVAVFSDATSFETPRRELKSLCSAALQGGTLDASTCPPDDSASLTTRGGRYMDRPCSTEKIQRYKLQRDALKWLLVCCFGYTGYKNARFGKIEAHEAINAVARETLLVAKEMAEDRGYKVLHALVDSLYVQKAGATRDEYEALTAEIAARTQLPLAIEAIYRYVVFLPSRQFEDVPVPNRFFAVAEDGALKVRGLELRRHDTPPLIARMQQQALTILAEAHDLAGYTVKLEEAREILRGYEESLADGSVAVEDLIVSKRLTRAPREYQKANQTAIAAQQLLGSGVQLRPGQTVEYIITDFGNRVPNDRVRAYALWDGWFGYYRRKYAELLREAFEPLALGHMSQIALNKRKANK